MSDRAWLATRKGLFEMRHQQGRWQIERSSFLGEPVSAVLPPGPGGTMLAGAKRARLPGRGKPSLNTMAWPGSSGDSDG